MKIISISGLDGSGKSTQAKLLQEYFEKQGKKAHYFHAIQFSLAQKIKGFRDEHCLICRFTGTCKKSLSTEEKSVTEANRLQLALRKIFFLIDVCRFSLLRSKLQSSGCDYIISDRYFYDSVVNISFLSHRNTPSRVERFIPAADVALYLKVEPEAIMSRDRIPDQGMDYLKAKKHLYDMYASLWNFDTVDGSADQQTIFERIKQLSSRN